MSKWTSALTLTVAAAMVATTAFAQSGSGSANTTSSQMPGAKQPDGGAPGTTGATKPDTTSPSASPGTSATTPSASPGTTDSTKSDTMKSEKMSKGRGMRSAGGNREQVKAVQQALKDKGHDPGTVDGVMGPKTRSALKDFQKKEGMKDTGQLDQDTMSKLGVEAKTSGMGQAPGSASPATSTPSASPGAGSTGSTPGTPETKSDSSATEKK